MAQRLLPLASRWHAGFETSLCDASTSTAANSGFSQVAGLRQARGISFWRSKPETTPSDAQPLASTDWTAAAAVEPTPAPTDSDPADAAAAAPASDALQAAAPAPDLDIGSIIDVSTAIDVAAVVAAQESAFFTAGLYIQMVDSVRLGMDLPWCAPHSRQHAQCLHFISIVRHRHGCFA